MRTALMVTIAEGVEFQPACAFASSWLRRLGFEVKHLATDFCTAHAAFRDAVGAARPDAVVFRDAAEWREVIAMLSTIAWEATDAPIVALASAAQRPPGMPARIRHAADGDDATLAAALGVEARDVPVASLALDYGPFGGAALLRRAMGASLFADVGTLALLASRPKTGATSPSAALARLEAPVASGPVALDATAALAPLAGIGDGIGAVEWWDRPFRGSPDLLAAVARRVGRQSVRLLPEDATPARLAELRAHGVTRVVFDCDALDGGERVPGAAGTATEVAVAVGRARVASLGAGVVLVIGLPGESVAASRARCAVLREAAPERVRVVPFEPAGDGAAADRCEALGIWPPAGDRWKRELYQPLVQPEAADYAKVLEESLMLVADVAARDFA